jgi:hypothetical protein
MIVAVAAGNAPFDGCFHLAPALLTPGRRRQVEAADASDTNPAKASTLSSGAWAPGHPRRGLERLRAGSHGLIRAQSLAARPNVLLPRDLL